MADSKEVKSSKDKGKLISDTSAMIKENPKFLNHESDMPNNNLGASDSNDKMTQKQNAFFSSIIETFSDEIDNDPKTKQIVDFVKGIGEQYEKVTEQNSSDSKEKMTPEQRNALISNIIESFSDEIDNDPKSKQIVDLVKDIGKVYEKVTEQKAWALQKVAQSETKLSNDYLELQELRMAKAKRAETKYKRDHSEKSHAVKIQEESVQHANCDADAITDTVRRLESQNAQIRAETLAYKQISSKSEKQLREMLKRENKCTKKLGDMKNQTSASKTQYEKEVLWAEWMQQELVKVEKEAEEMELVDMADSKEVKPSKGKGIFLSDTSDMIKGEPEVFNPELHMPQVSNNNFGPSNCKYKMTPEQLNDMVTNIMATLSGSDIDNDPRAKQVVDMINDIRELHVTVTEKKTWALQRVAQSETRLGKDYLELQELRMAKAKRGETENMKEDLEKSLAVKIMEESVKRATCQAGAITDTVRRLELQNAQIRADTLAYKMTASESAKELREILKRGNKCAKKLADMEKQTSAMKEQYEKELLRTERMKQELIEAEKEADEAEMEWKQEIQEKERMLALVAEETRLARTQKASSRAYLSKLRQQVDSEFRMAEDERRRLEDEHRRLEDDVARLRVSRPNEDLLPENLDFLYNFDEAPSSSNIKLKSQLLCMMCMENVVSVVFLPCTHQVLCFPCYESNCEALRGCCPYCSAGIEQSFKVYGPSS